MNRSYIFSEFINYLNVINIDYVILGNILDYPESIDGDVDICVWNHQLKNFDKLVESFCQLHQNLKFIQKFQHETSCIYYIIADTFRVKSENYFHPDVCGHYKRFNKLFIPDKILLSEIKRVTFQDSYFYAPNDTNAFLYYLLKKSSKHNFQPRDVEYLKSLRYDFNLLATYFKNPDVLKSILASIENHSYSSINSACNMTLANYKFQRQNMLLNYIKDLQRIARRIVVPTGYVIALLGPDGSGKTTLSNSFLKNLEPAFRGIKRYHLRPYAFEAYEGFDSTPVINPHAKPPRSFFSSILKLGLFLVDYTIGYFIKVQKYKLKSHLVIFDRYYHDLSVDSRRYRFGARLWMAKLVGKLVQKPDLFIVLTGDPQTIWARKKEVSFDETDRQIKAYEDFAIQTKNALLIHTDRDINDCSQQISQYILDQLAKKYE